MGTYDDIIIQDDAERLFTAYATADIIDNQNQKVPISIFKKAFYKFLIRGATLHIVDENNKHSPLVVGKVISGEEEDKGDYKAFKILCQIYPHDADNSIYDDTWEGIKSGKYRGVSIGGGRPIALMKHTENGDTAELETVPLMEISVVERPANPLALITGFSMAKSEVSKVDKANSKYVTSDNKFKGGFDGCVEWATNTKGLPKENAEKLCAYIGRKAGVIKSDADADKLIKSEEYLSKPGDVDEAKWKEAKDKVKQEYKDVPEGSDKFYAIVMHIYQDMIKKSDSEVKDMAEENSQNIELAQALQKLAEGISNIQDTMGSILARLPEKSEDKPVAPEPKPDEAVEPDKEVAKAEEQKEDKPDTEQKPESAEDEANKKDEGEDMQKSIKNLEKSISEIRKKLTSNVAKSVTPVPSGAEGVKSSSVWSYVKKEKGVM